jgi:hypothetical protein
MRLNISLQIPETKLCVRYNEYDMLPKKYNGLTCLFAIKTTKQLTSNVAATATPRQYAERHKNSKGKMALILVLLLQNDMNDMPNAKADE